MDVLPPDLSAVPPTEHRPTVQVSNEVLMVVGVYLSIVAVASTVGNGSFVAVLLRCRAFRRDAHLILLMSMAVCDLGVSIFGYPFTIWSCFAGTWIFGDAICKMYAFTCFTLNLIAANTLAVISVFRYVVICKPQMKHRLTPTFGCICVVGTILYALIWTIPPFLGWSAYVKEPFDASCSFDWYDSSYSGMSYVFATIIFCYVSHLVVMGWCYHRIHKRVSQLKLDPLTLPAQSVTPSQSTTIGEDGSFCNRFFCFDTGMNFDNIHRNQKTYNLEIQVLKLNVLMVVSFFVIWSPYAIVSIASLYYPDLPVFWYIFPTVFAKTSCMMNPLLYGMTNASLRKELRRMWINCCRPKDEQLETTVSHHFHHHRSNQQHQEFGTSHDRPMYDKEGLYLGKVNQGTCACSGCIESRREVDMLIRLQTKRTRDSERASSTAAVTTSQSANKSDETCFTQQDHHQP